MFEQVLGLPAHPLLVHAAVVLVPLLAVGAIAFAVVPRLRPYIWWAVVLLALAAPGTALFAKLSGDAFRSRLVERNLISPDILADLDEHQAYGDIAMWLAIGLGVVTLILAYVAGDGTPLRGLRRGARPAPVDSPGQDSTGSSGEGSVGESVGASAAGSPAGGRHGRSTSPALVQVGFAVVAVGLALVTVFYVYLTGDSGARIVWSGF